MYDGTSIIACFSGVRSFRDLSLQLSKFVVREEVQEEWKRDDGGYETSAKVKRTEQLVPSLPAGDCDLGDES